jgi:hypothetical protein
MKTTRQILHEANDKIVDIRLVVMQELERLLPVGKVHTFNPDTSGLCVNDEEESTRLQVLSMDRHEVTLEDDSTMDLGDIGTDDLLTVLDTLDTELNPE